MIRPATFTGSRFTKPLIEILMQLEEQSTTILGDKYIWKSGGNDAFKDFQLRIPQCIARGGGEYLPIRTASQYMRLKIYDTNELIEKPYIRYKYRPYKLRTDKYAPKKTPRPDMLRYSTTRAIGHASESGNFELTGDPKTALEKYYISFFPVFKDISV